MTHATRLKLLSTLVLAGLSGCAHLPISDDGLSYLQRQVRFQAIDSWDMNGRIAVDTGQRAFQGRFQWRQSAESIELSIRGPLGTGILQVTGPLDKLTVRAQGKTWELSDPEPELSELLGWWLPVRSMQAWLLGFSDPMFSSEEEFGPDRTLQALEQRLWRLTYDSYKLSQGLLLPRRIDLSHGSLELRVIIDRWRPLS